MRRKQTGIATGDKGRLQKLPLQSGRGLSELSDENRTTVHDGAHQCLVSAPRVHVRLHDRRGCDDHRVDRRDAKVNGAHQVKRAEEDFRSVKYLNKKRLGFHRMLLSQGLRTRLETTSNSAAGPSGVSSS